MMNSLLLPKCLRQWAILLMFALPFALSAQTSNCDVNNDGEITIADVNEVIDAILTNSHNMAADVNNDGEISIADVNEVIDLILNGDSSDGENEGGIVEPTEMEQGLSRWTCNEDSVKITTYSYADSIELDALAREVLELFAPKDSDENEIPSLNMKFTSGSGDDLDDLAEEAIRENGRNIFSNSLIIEQQDWNSGNWGKTHYGGFETYFNTHVKNGKRCLLIVFYYKGGFPNSKTASIKLGQVNSGKFIDAVTIDAGQEYAYIDIQIDDNLGSHGCVNYFPLLVTSDSKARNYLNPIMVKTIPIIDGDWKNQYFGYEFGTINGVSVYYNKDSSSGRNQSVAGDATYQCVELCKRYITDQYDFINHPYTDQNWGDAKLWPTRRADDEAVWGDKYMVIANDGNERVREGDIIVWNRGQYGHVGVVIKTGKDDNGEYVSIAHQNGGTGTYAFPIGMKLKVVDKVIKNVVPGKNFAPIFTTSVPISHFIRVYNKNEEKSIYSSSLTASTTYLRFGKRDVGTSYTRKFTITNHGSSTLTISSMTFAKGDAYKINIPSCTIGCGVTKEFEVTFTPTASGDFDDRLIIRSDAKDNPVWNIRLLGVGVGAPQPQTETIPVGNTGLSITMVKVDGGTFTMGGTEEQGTDANSLEVPVHQVTLSDYCIAQLEVTQELWVAVMGSNPSHFTGDMKCPVEYMSWNDCQTFITKLNQMTGRQFRLPTEAEWEFAARGGTYDIVTKYSGSDDPYEVAWFYFNSESTTHPVGQKAPNELGLYDMSGNVYEWCQDWYSEHTTASQTNPKGPATGEYRIVRGGHWGSTAKGCRVSYRNGYWPTSVDCTIGLRLAMDAE